MAGELSFDKAWKFSVRFNPYSRSIDTSEGDVDIKESLRILLSTAPGERFMEPEYGCDLSPLAFKRLNLSLETQMTNDIKRAIEIFEPRVDVKGVYLESEDSVEGCINIKIDYRVKLSNVEYSTVHLYEWEG